MSSMLVLATSSACCRACSTVSGPTESGMTLSRPPTLQTEPWEPFTKRHARCSNGKTDEAPSDRPHGTE